MNENLFWYKATVVNIYDGDTVTLSFDLGFNIWSNNQKVRLYGINTPEIRGEEREQGLAARDYLRSLLSVDSICLVHTIKDSKGKYGRWLAELYLDDGTNINQLLIQKGFAQPYSR